MIFPELQTNRLILRKILPGDAEVILIGYSDPSVYKHMSVSYHSIDEVKIQLNWYEELFANQSGIWWGICLRDTDTMIGNAGFHQWNHLHRSAELGYWILPEYQKNGYGIESINALCRFGFESLLLHRIEAIVEKENMPSKNLLIHSGFHLDGVKRECEMKDDGFISLEIWSKLETEQMI